MALVLVLRRATFDPVSLKSFASLSLSAVNGKTINETFFYTHAEQNKRTEQEATTDYTLYVISCVAWRERGKEWLTLRRFVDSVNINVT